MSAELGEEETLSEVLLAPGGVDGNIGGGEVMAVR